MNRLAAIQYFSFKECRDVPWNVSTFKFIFGFSNAEIAPGVEVTSIITKSSYESMGIEVGKEVYAVVKSTDVLIGVD